MKKFLMGLLCVVVFLGVCMTGTEAMARKGTTIQKGVFIKDIDVSGMSEQEATQAVEEYLAGAGNAVITLQCVGDNEVTITPAELGMTWVNTGVARQAAGVGSVGNIVTRYKALKDLQKTNKVFPLELQFDEHLIEAIILEQCDKYNQEAIDVSLQKTGDTFEIVEGQQGLVLDTEASKTAIKDFLTGEWDGTDATIKLPVIVEEPMGSAEELSMVKDVLGTYTTEYRSSGSYRSANITNGCAKINGTTLYPGDSFSMMELVAPFTTANGYYMAGSYLNGMVVDSLGGGICQVSTTLYNAVLLSELEIEERNNHSMVVSYVPPSADAAIAESAGKDFKFINTSQYPIYIEGYTTPNKEITFTIYGVEDRAANRQVKYETEIVETIQPTTENIIQTAEQPLGFASIQSAYVGYKAKLWKVVTVDGVVESREVVNSSNYKMVPRTITVGVATDNQEAYNQIQAAIATGSIDQVKAVADAWAAWNAGQAAGQQLPQPDIHIAPPATEGAAAESTVPAV